MKKCPFRKEYFITDYHWEGQIPLPQNAIEEFADCIGSECMAWKEGPTDEHVPYVWNYCELTKGH